MVSSAVPLIFMMPLPDVFPPSLNLSVGLPNKLVEAVATPESVITLSRN